LVRTTGFAFCGRRFKSSNTLAALVGKDRVAVCMATPKKERRNSDLLSLPQRL
jgi:hypothetical protein